MPHHIKNNFLYRVSLEIKIEVEVYYKIRYKKMSTCKIDYLTCRGLYKPLIDD